MGGHRLLMRPALWAGCVALTSFVLYVMTMSPTVGFIDSGELAAVAATLGVAHPTGYPLFTMLGWIAVHLPFGGEEIVRLNYMAALMTAGAVFMFFLCAHRIIAALGQRMPGGKKVDPRLILSASAGGTALLAFSETFWLQAVSVEVYSLHLLLVGVILLLLLHGRDEGVPGYWYAAAFLVGISFSNHMTTMLLLPGVFYMYFADGPRGQARWTVLARAAGFFLFGLTPYLYLPLRAIHSPVMNWGNATSLERLYFHVSGKQFRVWIFSSPEVPVRQFSYFLSSVPAEFAYVGLLFGFIGVVSLWRYYRKAALWTLILFFVCLGYAVNYDIHDIDSYFLLAYVCIGLWAGCGVFVTAVWCVRRAAWGGRWIAVASVLVGVVPVALHYGSVDESRNFLVEDYTRNMFASLRPGAVVLSFQWDYWVSAAHYYQLVRGERMDIAVIDKELLRRSWYFRVLEVRYPWLIEGSRAEVDAFLKELYKFEHDLPYAPQVIEARYTAMIMSFIEKSIATRPVYVTGEVEPQYTGRLRRIPEGLAFRLSVGEAGNAAPLFPEFSIRPFTRKGRLEDMVWRLYADAYTALGLRFRELGDMGKAQEAFARAARLSVGDPGNSGGAR
jgi:hypothetical protein